MSERSYRGKRNKRQTGRSRNAPVFVIQKHDASSLHYDFRLEVNGALKSWAVPRGPSTDPRDKRLAIPTEDHSLDYADFEGCIPEGEYGAGTVLIWDRGRYENMTTRDGSPWPMARAIEDGHVLVNLRGSKLVGGYALHRTGGSDARRWLLIKMDDQDADARRNPVSTEPRSVVSDRTLEQIAADDDARG